MFNPFQNIYGCFLCVSIALAMEVSAQSIVVVEDGAELKPVIGMSGENLLIEDDGASREVDQSRARMVAASVYADGRIHVLDKKAGVNASFAGDGSSFNFQFAIAISAERDFEDCFGIFIVESKEGKTFQKIVDLGDIKVGKQQIDVSFSAAVNFGNSRYGYAIFSKGEEIEVDDPFRKKAAVASNEKQARAGASPADDVSRARANAGQQYAGQSSRLDATPARVVEQHIPEYPLALSGSGINGIARIVYTMDQSGRVVEILDMEADHPAFLYAARDTVLKSRYKPSIYEGQPLVTTIEQVFAFNEFVCFAEAAEIVPYPEIKNREPLAVYGPNREELAERLKKVAGKSVALEIEINELGQVVSVGAKGVDSEVVARTFDNAFASWVFLPSLDQGVAYSKRVRLRLADSR